MHCCHPTHHQLRGGRALPSPGKQGGDPEQRQEVADVAIYHAKEGIKGGKKRRKQCP
jgi:hypothetical protein